MWKILMPTERKPKFGEKIKRIEEEEIEQINKFCSM